MAHAVCHPNGRWVFWNNCRWKIHKTHCGLSWYRSNQRRPFRISQCQGIQFEIATIQKSILSRHCVHERNITLVPGFDEQYWNLVQESVQRAQILAIETSTLLFFKANVQQYLILRPLFDALGNVTYAGYYRENVLDRCVCMVRDCFQEAESFGSAVFGHNGTETDLCFQRREHPEWNVQAKFTNVENCLKEGQNRVDVIRGQDFDSFTDKELFRFEQSTSNDDFQLSVEAWMDFLQPLLQGALDREIVASVLEEGRGTRETSSQESKVYNYVELKEELIRSPKWEGFLHN